MRLLTFTIRLYLLSILYIPIASAADLVSELTTRDLSLGSITIGTGSPLSLAGQGDLPIAVSANYRDKFTMKEMAAGSLVGLYRSSFMTNVAMLSSAGYEDYRQTLLSLRGQKDLSEKLSFGVALSAISVSSITLEKNIWEVRPQIGFEYKLSDPITFGATIRNPVNLGSDQHERLETPFAVLAGVSYQISTFVLLASEYEWQDYNYNCLRLGIEYALIPEFKIRAGINSHPFSPSFGIGYSYQNWILDITSEYHRYLGTSLSVGLSYNFNK